jgi:hypothetical protein
VNVTDASITDICTHSRRKTISKRTDLYGKKGESYRRNGASGLKKRTQKNAKNRSRNVNVWRKSDVESSKSVARKSRRKLKELRERPRKKPRSVLKKNVACVRKK